MIQAYRIVTTLLYPLLFIFLYYRKLINKEDPLRYKEKIFTSHFNAKRKDDYKLIWFHAASIGEFKSIIPILEQLNINKNLKFLITTTTLSSGKIAKIELEKFNNVEHRFFPLDIDFLIKKFLYLWKPDKIFLVDSEIWPNLILNAKKNKISISLLNARITSKSFKRWMMFPKVAKKIFGLFDMCLCSNIETKEFLERLELKKVYFKGNIKLTNLVDKKKIKDLNEDFLMKKRFWLAASIHKDEDVFCLKTHLNLKKKLGNIVTIIAPRHVERSGKIKILSERLNLETQILNHNEKILDNKEIIIINYFGALNNYYKYAKSVFIGKSMDKKLKNESGQNPIEAAKLNCKIYHGPYVYNFKDIYKILEINNITKKIENFEDLSSNLFLDLKNENEKFKSSNLVDNLGQQTLKETMILINRFIENET
tara:strand:- start:10376 stop:11650 length:1275 start_codon:yes stop_codon:yes gene_type:complete